MRYAEMADILRDEAKEDRFNLSDNEVLPGEDVVPQEVEDLSDGDELDDSEEDDYDDEDDEVNGNV